MKVAFNACYGGFSLSDQAVQLGRTISGSPLWGEGSGRSLLRHEKILINVIETLGKEANGFCADIEVEDIEGNQYIIDEYDGREHVVEPKDINWIKIKDDQ